MKKASIFIKAFIILAAAIGLARLSAAYGPWSQKAVATVSTPQVSDAAELAILKQEVASLRRDLTEIHQGTSQEAPASVPSSSEERAEEKEEPRERPSGAQISHALDMHLAQQGREPAWSAEAEASIAGLFQSGALKGSALLRADCATTLCRVEVSHDNAAIQDQFLQNVRTLPPFAQEGIARRVDDGDPGASKTVIYVAREGYPLPSLDDGHT